MPTQASGMRGSTNPSVGRGARASAALATLGTIRPARPLCSAAAEVVDRAKVVDRPDVDRQENSDGSGNPRVLLATLRRSIILVTAKGAALCGRVVWSASRNRIRFWRLVRLRGKVLPASGDSSKAKRGMRQSIGLDKQCVQLTFSELGVTRRNLLVR
jgi:hypothetical protein